MGFGIKTKIINFAKNKINFYHHFGPEIIRINPIGYACTNACPMCWRVMNKISKKGGLEKTELQWKHYKKLLNDIPFTVKSIEVVGGGEPLLFPKIENLFKKIKEKNIHSSLITNGVLLTPKISKLLIKLKWDLIRVSINAGSKEVYTSANGTYYFDKVVSNVNKLVELKKNKNFPKIGLHFVIQKSNFKDIQNFINLSNNLKIDFISFDNLIYDSPKNLKLNKSEIKQLEKILNKVKKETKIENNIDQIIKKLNQGHVKRDKSYYKNRYCQIVQSNLDISSEGVSVPCCMAYGEGISKNLKDKDMKTIWKEFAPFRKELKQGKFKKFCYEKCNYPLEKKK
jgi:wyosine [tRNA(Phe)-imidazoG37] synthetase (radical SAM superfamily)